MTFTTALQTDSLAFPFPADEMANYVLLVEWMVKQQQLYYKQQAHYEKPHKELEALNGENLLHNVIPVQTQKTVVSKQYPTPFTRPTQETF
ncbi:hypothetical protein [Moorena sp. SIO4G3]|uniref:hypothetical protein n=1 Tax=Moorena sp. SIO4G3 TaxID=2607821 RepID=UPI0025D8541B|nr:hypothetical protein [Moorena sp. SIO4G3]